MRRVVGAVLAAVLALGVLTSCDDDAAPSGKSNVEVDTPELREMKAAAGIDDCVPGTGDPDGSDLPSLTLPCLGGGPDVDLATLRGPLLLNLWYSGCAPCRAEMPLLQQAHDDYAGRVAVLGLDVETYPEAAISFADDIGATYPQVADPGATIFDDEDLRLRPAYPQTLFVDADGKVTHVEVGEIDSVDQARELIETHLGVAP